MGSCLLSTHPIPLNNIHTFPILTSIVWSQHVPRGICQQQGVPNCGFLWPPDDELKTQNIPTTPRTMSQVLEKNQVLRGKLRFYETHTNVRVLGVECTKAMGKDLVAADPSAKSLQIIQRPWEKSCPPQSEENLRKGRPVA